MSTAILIFFVVLGVIFVVACLIAPAMKKNEEKTEPVKRARHFYSLERGAIVRLEDEEGALAFVRGYVPVSSSFEVLLWKNDEEDTSDEKDKMDVWLCRLRDEDEKLDYNTDRTVEPIEWISEDNMVGRIPDGEQIAIVRCTKEDFAEKSVISNVSRAMDFGFEIGETHYSTKVVNVRKVELISIPEVYLKK